MIYPYRCKECESTQDVYVSRHEEIDPPVCACGQPMGRDYQAQNVQVHNDVKRSQIGGYRMSEKAEQKLRDETREYGERNSQTVTDGKGMPYLDENFKPIRKKQWDDSYSQKFKEHGLA